MTAIIKPFKKGYKYPIYPTEEQKVLLEKTFGCCRYVWNKALAEAKQEYEHYLVTKQTNPIIELPKPDVSGYAFVNKLIVFKSNLDSIWLSEVNAVSLQQTMLHLGSSFNTFFKSKKGYPQNKKKANKQSFSLMRSAFRFINKELFIAKSKEPLAIGWGRNGKVRELPSEPTSCVISKTTTGQYYISFVCEYVPMKTNGTGQIGIDLGLKDFITISTGEKVKNPKHLKQFESILKRRQQSLSKKKKGSKNRVKARIVVAKVHESITNQRTNFIHQLTRRLVNENQVIGLEKLMVKNMVRNRRLSKAISDAAWSRFTTTLEYKVAESQHCSIVYMDTFYPSSHICNVTKLKLDRKLKLSERTWICPHCKQKHDRDINAACNMRDEALRVMEDYKQHDLRGRVVLATSHL